MANDGGTADQLRAIAMRGLTSEQFEALLATQQFRDEDDWRAAPGAVGFSHYCPVRFLAYVRHFGIKGAAPKECAEWPELDPATIRNMEARGTLDYTYFALSRLDGSIKIGRSRMPEYRISSLHNDRNGMPATPLVIIPEGAREKMYHRVFARWRESGEWFAPHPDILAEIARLTPHV